MQISAVLKTLEAKQLIDRRRDGQDERVKIVSVTKEGAVLLRNALPLVEAAQKRFFGPDEKTGIDLSNALKAIVIGW
jgi:DNA-binding MarR family transcriptional regulator